MRVSCSKCGQSFESVIVDRQKALVELENLTGKHLQKSHPALLTDLQMAVQACMVSLARLIHFNGCVTVPENEEFILEVLEENQDTVMLGIGFEPTEDEEEDDSEELDDDEDVGLIELPEEDKGNVIEMIPTEKVNG